MLYTPRTARYQYGHLAIHIYRWDVTYYSHSSGGIGEACAEQLPCCESFSLSSIEYQVVAGVISRLFHYHALFRYTHHDRCLTILHTFISLHHQARPGDIFSPRLFEPAQRSHSTRAWLVSGVAVLASAIGPGRVPRLAAVRQGVVRVCLPISDTSFTRVDIHRHSVSSQLSRYTIETVVALSDGHYCAEMRTRQQWWQVMIRRQTPTCISRPISHAFLTPVCSFHRCYRRYFRDKRDH